MAYAISGTSTTSAPMNSQRTYQRGWSKARMNAHQVQRERQHPQERHAGDVLRHVVGDREQHHRAHRRQRQPFELGRRSGERGARQRPSAPRARSRSAIARRWRRRAARTPRTGTTSPSRARASRTPARTAPGSRAARAAKRSSTARRADTAPRCGSGARTRPAAAAWWSTAGSTADRSSPRAAAGCAPPAPRRRAASSRSTARIGRQQRCASSATCSIAWRRAPEPARPVGIGIAGEQRSGRTPGRWSTPPAEPPNHGRICLAMIGWTRNSRNAERKIVPAYGRVAASENGVATEWIGVPGLT